MTVIFPNKHQQSKAEKIFENNNYTFKLKGDYMIEFSNKREFEESGNTLFFQSPNNIPIEFKLSGTY
jgi:hypothetical protein